MWTRYVYKYFIHKIWDTFPRDLQQDMQGLCIWEGKELVAQSHWRFLVIRPQGIRGLSLNWDPSCHHLCTARWEDSPCLKYMKPSHEIVGAYFNNPHLKKYYNKKRIILVQWILYYYNAMHLNSAGFLKTVLCSRGANCRQAGSGLQVLGSPPTALLRLSCLLSPSPLSKAFPQFLPGVITLVLSLHIQMCKIDVRSIR